FLLRFRPRESPAYIPSMKKCRHAKEVNPSFTKCRAGKRQTVQRLRAWRGTGTMHAQVVGRVFVCRTLGSGEVEILNVGVRVFQWATSSQSNMRSWPNWTEWIMP